MFVLFCCVYAGLLQILFFHNIPQLEMIHKVLRLHPFLAMGVLCYAFLTSALIINIIQFLVSILNCRYNNT